MTHIYVCIYLISNLWLEFSGPCENNICFIASLTWSTNLCPSVYVCESGFLYV